MLEAIIRMPKDIPVLGETYPEGMALFEVRAISLSMSWS